MEIFEIITDCNTIEELTDCIEDVLDENNIFDPIYSENWGKPYYLKFKDDIYEFSFCDSGKSDEPQNGNYGTLMYLFVV